MLNKKQFSVLPFMEQVINRVEELAKQQGEGLIKNGVPRFEWKNQQEVEDVVNDEEEQHEQDDEHLYVSDDDASISDRDNNPDNKHMNDADDDDNS